MGGWDLLFCVEFGVFQQPPRSETRIGQAQSVAGDEEKDLAPGVVLCYAYKLSFNKSETIR